MTGKFRTRLTHLSWWIDGHRWQTALLMVFVVAVPTGTGLAVAHYATVRTTVAVAATSNTPRSSGTPAKGTGVAQASGTAAPIEQPVGTGGGAKLGSLAAIVTLSRPTYRLSLVSISGSVVAETTATLPSSPSVSGCAQAGCDRSSFPFVSTSDTRAYYLDGDKRITALTPDGKTTDVLTLDLPAKTMAAFAVSSDDSRIAISYLDYSALPAGQMAVRLVVEDINGANRNEIFSSAALAEWPVGWSATNLVVAVGARFDGPAPNPYSASEYHLVDPRTGQRISNIGQPAAASGAPSGTVCNRGPLSAAGTACYVTSLGATELGFQDWGGYYHQIQRFGGSDAGSQLALSPDGQSIAAQLTGSQGGVLAVIGAGNAFAGTGEPLGWLNGDEMVVRTGGHLAIDHLGAKATTALSFDGSFIGTVPESLTGIAAPSGRGAPQFAYDSGNHVAVLFGGNGQGGEMADTWTWDGRRWALQNSDQAPPPREGGAFVYDPVHHLTLLFGGWNYQKFFDDTWAWNGKQWLPYIVATHPSARGFSGVAFDTKNKRVVLFGGWNGSDYYTDMWAWDGLNWSQLTLPSDTPKLNVVGTAYQSDGKLLVVGESTRGAGTMNGLQSWSFDGSNWTATGLGSPCAHHYGGAAQNLDTGGIVVFGGECTSSNETATLDGTQWAIAKPALAPAARGDEVGRPGMTYDTDHHVMLLFGGKSTTSGQLPTDTWAWDGSAWTRVD